MKTIKITYTSSAGYEVDLKAAPVHIKSANFHNYTWKREKVALRYGETVTGFYKAAQVYQTTLYFEHDPELIATIHGEWERDVLTQRPGRITWNGQYIECFISSSSTYPTAGNAFVANEVEIYCPDPFWIKETAFEFAAGTETGDYLDYPYGYDYDFGSAVSGRRRLLWGFERGLVAFKAVVHGPCSAPVFTIAGRQFGADVVLQEGETLTIDTRASAPTGEQVYTTSAGQKANVFYARTGEIAPFIADEYGTLVWPQTFALTLNIYMGRSEPSWI